jgi:hypothetical protein
MLNIDLGIGLLKPGQAIRRFFDKPAVTNALDKATLDALSRSGAFVRRTAKGLIRNRKRSSKPGQPPSNRTGFLREFIYFAYDDKRQAVVVGPARLNGRAARNLAGRTLEFGGPVVFKEHFVADDAGKVFWTVNVANNKHLGQTRTSTATIQPRPYMMPALMENLPKIPAQFANALTPT